MSRLSRAQAQLREMARLLLERYDDPRQRCALMAAYTADDPLRFALWFLPHHLRTDGEVTLSTVHEDWVGHAQRWTAPHEPSRDIFIAPRSMGKSSWHFLILPCWAGAHGHKRFIAAFSDSAAQAEQHLASLKHEFDSNSLLREAFPDLCKAAKRPAGANISDNRAMLHTASGFVFAARGIDSGNLGMKVGEVRPDLLVLDDVEPGESNYSAYQVGKRLSTITDVVLPLNYAADVTVVGTTTMTGSIIHQAVQHDADPKEWIKDERFTVHHALPFDDEGESIWPEKWPTDWLRSQMGLPSFAKNYLNQPRVLDGEYWTEADYRYGDLPTVSRRVIAVDPAVTTAKTSDETGIAVVGYSAAERQAVVNEAIGVRLKGEPLRLRLLDLLAKYPDVAEILWERNAGGEMMAGSVLHDMPVRVTTIHNSEKKEVRMERALSYYRRGVVLHAISLPNLEAQQQEFPKGLHDDIADAVGMGLDHLAAPRKQPLRSATR